jgi:transposase
VRLRVVVKRTQLTKLGSERNQGKTITMSAMKAGMSRNTARKFLRQTNITEQRAVPHTWRTRADPLETIWPTAISMLRNAPELEAKALFEHLAAGGEDEIKPGLLRTFQRRVKAWRLKEGAEKEIFFTQEVRPGETLAVDWTDMKALCISIEGRVLDHKLFHAVLPYSNWEWAVRAQSESVLSLRGGLKAVLGRLGRVPRRLLTDQSSTATHQLGGDGKRRGFNEEYLNICAHYGMEPRVINVARPQENGSCESAHGHLKRRIQQHLLLRGSRDFASEAEYEQFLIGVLEKANALRSGRVSEELAVMRETSVADLPDYRELMVVVGNNSTIRLRKQVYSVPSRLIGAKLLARIYENRIVLLKGADEVAQLPLGKSDRGAVIDYRHLIEHLLRKPGAFACYRWREEMFPAPVYRSAYDYLVRSVPGEADRRYLEILKVAADEGQTAVENALEMILGGLSPVVSAAEVRGMLATWREMEAEWRQRAPLEVSLSVYDALLESEESSEWELLEAASSQKQEVAHAF